MPICGWTCLNLTVGFTEFLRMLSPMAMNGDQSAAKQNRQKGGFLMLLIVLGGALAALCHQGFLPLGAMMDPSNRLPGTFAGHWATLYYIGGSVPSSSPSFTTLLQMIFPPEI
jgi:hypothetical protein